MIKNIKIVGATWCLLNLSSFAFAQDVINPYTIYSSVGYPAVFQGGPASISFPYPTVYSNISQPLYIGEYELNMEKHFWFTSGIAGPCFNQTNPTGYAFSYQYELVSFPFTQTCAFTNSGCTQSSSQTQRRELFMPNVPGDAVYDPLGYWDYNNWPRHLYRITPLTMFECEYSYDGNFANTLVSAPYIASTGIGGTNGLNAGRRGIPHSVIKHTINLHCGNSLSSPIVDKLIFYYDNTRGRMRWYPFRGTNSIYNSSDEYDVVFIPELIVNNGIDPVTNLLYEHKYDDNGTPSNIIMPNGALNYFPYNEVLNYQACGINLLPQQGDPFRSYTNIYNFVYPSAHTVYSVPLRSTHGELLAGYEFSGSSITLKPGLKHNYFLDQNTNLTILNPTDRIIYNPSEVTITADNLFFPAMYTFKTIRGVYPTVAQVTADNITENGGPYSDLRDVPVKTDLTSENPADASNLVAQTYPYLFASRYYLDNYLNTNPKLTIENCVKLLDCTFDVKQGATLIFNNYPYTVTKEDHGNDHVNTRYKIQTLGGAVLRNYAPVQYLQNGSITQPYALNYFAVNEIYAGKNVDPDTDVPSNDYSIEPGADVTFQASDVIYLKDGFSAKQGCTFNAIIATTINTNGCPVPSSGERNSGNTQGYVQTQNHTAVTASPNPTTGTLRLLQNNKPFKAQHLKITDAFGRIVFSKKNYNSNSDAIDLSHQPNGIYLATCVVNDELQRVKFVVQR